MPETSYHRKPPAENRRGDRQEQSEDEKKIEIEVREDTSSIPRKKSYLEELSIYNGIHPTNASVLTLLVKPFLACLTPVCLWAGLLYGVAITWLVLIATGIAQVFSAPR